MRVCRVSTVLAHAMLVYTLASAVYLCVTRFVDTPFADTLTDAQREVKAESARTRGAIFAAALAGCAVAVLGWSPFAPCAAAGSL